MQIYTWLWSILHLWHVIIQIDEAWMLSRNMDPKRIITHCRGWMCCLHSWCICQISQGQAEDYDPAVCHCDYNYQGKTETQVEEQHYHPVMGYHYNYNYCDTHQSQSCQDDEDESVHIQPSDHTQVLLAVNP
jgi:hypothetical protein